MVEREAAGGVVYRRVPGRPGDEPGGAAAGTADAAGAGGPVRYEFLMILDAYGHWALPKGGIEPGETPEAAALREIREETGIVGAIERRLPDVRYRFHDRGEEIDKRVHYFLVRALNHGVRIQTEEIRDAAWVPYDEALRRCSYENLRPALEAAAEHLGLAEQGGEATGAAPAAAGTPAAPRTGEAGAGGDATGAEAGGATPEGATPQGATAGDGPTAVSTSGDATATGAAGATGASGHAGAGETAGTRPGGDSG